MPRVLLIGDQEPFYRNIKFANCHSLSLDPGGRLLAVAATHKGSNGNGRRLAKDGRYAGNTSPIQLLELAGTADTVGGPDL